MKKLPWYFKLSKDRKYLVMNKLYVAYASFKVAVKTFSNTKIEIKIEDIKK